MAVERVHEIIALEPESDPGKANDLHLGDVWPPRGEIAFEDYTMSYS